MKKVILLQVIAVIILVAKAEITAAQDNAYLNFVKIDSAYVYRWDITDSDWRLNQIQYYGYTDGRITSLLTRNYETAADVALSEYVYDSSGRRESSTNYTWTGDWVPATRYLNEYDPLGRASSVRLQKWVNGEWAEERLQQNYLYDSGNLLLGYETIFWRNNSWTPPTVSELSYNSDGRLEYHLATRPGGNIDYRIIYEYDDMGLMTQFYTQYPAGEGWSNWNLRTVQYDGCGRKVGQTNYSGEGPDWYPSTRLVLYSSFDMSAYPGRKVPVCHNGHTIRVSVAAVPAHLRHGDCLGVCLHERQKPSSIAGEPPFTVFPNPATDRITVRFNAEADFGQKRVELTDFSGKLIRSYPVTDNTDLLIERGRLKSGYYNVRLITGSETFSQTVIFE